MSEEPRISDHPDADHPAREQPAEPDQEGLGAPTDPTDPLKRPDDQPGADPVTAPVPPG